MNNIDTKHPVLKNFDTSKSTVASPEQRLLENELRNQNEKSDGHKKEEKKADVQSLKKEIEKNKELKKAKEIVRDPLKLLKAF